MSITKSLNIEIDELCRELNIPKEDLLNFINNPDLINQQLPVSTHTAVEVINEFLQSNFSTKHSTKKSYKSFLKRLKTYILNKNPDLLINKLNEIILNDFFKTCRPRKGQQLSSRTRDTYKAIIKRIYKFAFDNEYINKDLRGRIELESEVCLASKKYTLWQPIYT